MSHTVTRRSPNPCVTLSPDDHLTCVTLSPDDPVGGYGQLDEEARREIRVLAGVEFTRRGKPQPTAGERETGENEATPADRVIRRTAEGRCFNSVCRLSFECIVGMPTSFCFLPNTLYDLQLMR